MARRLAPMLAAVVFCPALPVATVAVQAGPTGGDPEDELRVEVLDKKGEVIVSALPVSHLRQPSSANYTDEPFLLLNGGKCGLAPWRRPTAFARFST